MNSKSIKICRPTRYFLHCHIWLPWTVHPCTSLIMQRSRARTLNPPADCTWYKKITNGEPFNFCSPWQIPKIPNHILTPALTLPPQEFDFPPSMFQLIFTSKMQSWYSKFAIKLFFNPVASLRSFQSLLFRGALLILAGYCLLFLKSLHRFPNIFHLNSHFLPHQDISSLEYSHALIFQNINHHPCFPPLYHLLC